MEYSFTCPLEECGETMTVEAKNRQEAEKKLSKEAKKHLEDVHPDVKKTAKEIQADVKANMTQ